MLHLPTSLTSVSALPCRIGKTKIVSFHFSAVLCCMHCVLFFILSPQLDIICAMMIVWTLEDKKEHYQDCCVVLPSVL